MAAEYQKAINDEMFGRIVLEIYEYVKDGRLSKMRVEGVAREIADKCDKNGERIFYDARYPGEKREIKKGTFYERVRNIVTDWRKYLTPLMETLIIEATYQQALKAKDNPASFKTAASVIMPKESVADEDELALSPSVAAILQHRPVGTTIVIGQGGAAQRAGDNGHERPDTGDSVADRNRTDRQETEDIAFETVPPGHDKSIHGVHEGRDTAQRPVVPDTSVAPEDAIDDDGRGDMGTP